MSGLYIHIPFCNKKCLYCDFFSGNQLYLIDNYIDALVREIFLRHDYVGNSTINTIYFGGGTPSILSENHYSKIFNCIYKNFDVSNKAEITIECNPENINRDYVNLLIDSGFNRISLGIQFLNDSILEKFNRNHSEILIFESLDVIEESLLTNLSVDLIYSVPGVDDQDLFSSLHKLMQYNIKHVSAYSLTISKNSQLFWKIKKGWLIENNEDQFLSQYRIIYDYLRESGFIHYEVSNYALEGFYSQHNLAYWNQVSYLGVGVSAHSYNMISRQWNHTNIKKYIRELNEFKPKISFEIEQLSDIQLYNEYIILRLRTFQGISKCYIESNFSINISNHFVSKMNLLKQNDHFIFKEDLIIPKESDLLISDYLAKILIY